MGTRPQAQLAGRKRLRMVMACLLGAAVAGLVVGMVAAVVAYTIGESSCPPEDDQCANGLLAGFGVGILAAAGATTISIFLLSLRARLGWTFAVGSAVAVGLLTAASILLQSGWSLPLSLLSALLLVTVTVLTHRRAATSSPETKDVGVRDYPARDRQVPP